MQPAAVTPPSKSKRLQGQVLIAMMLARERADADGCTALAASLAALPSRPLEMVAEAVAALGYADLAELLAPPARRTNRRRLVRPATRFTAAFSGLASPRRQSGNDPVVPAATDGAQWQVYNEQDWEGHEPDPRGNGQYQIGY